MEYRRGVHMWVWVVLFTLVAGTQASSVTQGVKDSGVDKTQFTYGDIFDSKLMYESFNGQWLNNSLLYRNEVGDLLLWDPASGAKDVVVDAFLFKNQSIVTHSFSANMRYLLFSYDHNQKWIGTYEARYKIFDREKNGMDEAIIEFPNSNELRGSRLRGVNWAPKGLGLSFVFENDIYYQASPTDIPNRLTDTGDENRIYNGVSDRLYTGFDVQYWSPSAEYLVFATINDTGIPLMEFPIYGPSSDVYSRTAKIPYPKAGDKTESGGLGPNPVATLTIVRISDLSTRDIPVPETFANIDHYILQVVWTNSSHFMMTWCNRAWNHSVVSICEADTITCVKHLETKYYGGWINQLPAVPIFIEGGQRYVTLRSRDEGSSGKWQHVVLIPTKMDAEAEITFLTRGQREVSAVIAVDERRHLVYYMSNEGNPKDRQLFRVGLPEATGSLKQALCLTCDGECNYNSASISEGGEFYIRSCRGPITPYDALYSLVDPTIGEVLERNTKLEELVSTKLLPTRKFLQIPVGGGYMAHAEVFLPPGFSEDKKYPLLIATYGGPGAQEVLDDYSLDGILKRWRMYLGSVLGAVVVSVDGRGSGGRGDRYKYELYRRMGTVEVEDQAYAARYFKSMPYIDDTKGVAIFGWSYGGTVTSHALATYPVFSCGIAGAPVISSRYYETGYTEAVMGFDLPHDNEGGYNDTDITLKAVNMRGKKYMLAHGTADDTVDFMNTAQMVKALTNAEVQFKFRMYVDEPHRPRRISSIRHLLTAMTNFLRNDCWQMSDDPDDISGTSGQSQSLLLLFVPVLLLLMP